MKAAHGRFQTYFGRVMNCWAWSCAECLELRHDQAEEDQGETG